MDNFNARVDRAFEDGENKEKYYEDVRDYVHGKSVPGINSKTMGKNDNRNLSRDNGEITRD